MGTAAGFEWLTIVVVSLTGICGMITGIVLGQEIGRIRRQRQENAQLRQAEREYRGLFENAHDAILLFDPTDQAILDANEQASVLYGYSREELVGRSMLDLAVDRDRARQRIRAEAMSSDSMAFESQHRQKDGTIVDVEVKTSRVTYEGRPAILSTNRDVTARHKAEKAVRESEERFRLLLESVTDYAIVMLDVLGRVVSWNVGAERITGYSEDEVLGKSADMLSPPEEEETLRTQLAAAAEARSNEREVTRIRKDGSRFAALVTLTRIVDDAGELRGYAQVTRDITARVQLERMRDELMAVLESKASEWSGTFDAVQAPIVLIDEAGKIRRLNRSAQILSGRPFAELVQSRAADLPGEPWQTVAMIARDAFENGRTEPVRVSTGDSVWQVSCAMAGAYETRRAIVIAYDLTELTRLEASLRRNEVTAALGSLVAAVAHEVRNPLFTISATLDAWEARYGPAEGATRYGGALREQVDRLNRLMRDLLEYGKPNPLVFAATSLVEIIRSAAADCSALAAQRGVEIIHDLPDIPPIVLDAARMEQVFQNVIDNAIRHSPAGGSVRVTAALQDDTVVCRIVDQGPGLGNDEPEMLFVPMFTRRRGGTGLGLPIARKIVSAHGGTITMENCAESAGAIATIRLPLKTSPLQASDRDRMYATTT